jgi:hypothetical protein
MYLTTNLRNTFFSTLFRIVTFKFKDLFVILWKSRKHKFFEEKVQLIEKHFPAIF